MKSQIDALIADITKLQKAVLLIPEKFRLLTDKCLQITEAYHEAGDLEKALEWIINSQKYRERDFSLHYRAGLIAYELKNWNEVARQWSECTHENLEDELFEKIYQQTTAALEPIDKAKAGMLEFFARLLFECSNHLTESQVRSLQSKFGKKPLHKIAEDLALKALEKDPQCVYLHVLKSTLAENKELWPEAVRELEIYLKIKPNPQLQAHMRLLRLNFENLIMNDEKVDIFAHSTSAKSYYNAGVFYQNVRQGISRDSKDGQNLAWLCRTAYDLCLARFEKHFTHFTGSSEDGDLHVYSMCCRNRAMLSRLDEQHELSVELHTKGISTSPFFEHYNERSHAYYFLKRFEESGEDSEILLKEFAEHLDPLHTAIHYFRAIRGYANKNQFSQAKPLAYAALEYVDALTDDERNSLRNQIPALYDLCANVFNAVGDAEAAEQLKQKISEHGPSLSDVQGLLEQATVFLREQKWLDALPLMKEVSRIQPTNVDALNWRLWILGTLKNQAADPQPFNTEIKELCDFMLELTTTPSSSWNNIGKLALVKAYETALNNRAWLEFEVAHTLPKLHMGLAMINEALDPVYDHFRQDDLSALHNTKLKLEEKLAELFPEASQDIKSYYFTGAKMNQPRPLSSVYLGQWIKESVCQYFAYRQNQNIKPCDEEFQLEPSEIESGQKILSVEAAMKDSIMKLCSEPDSVEVPEYGILCNLLGDSSLIDYSLASLTEFLVKQDENRKRVH